MKKRLFNRKNMKTSIKKKKLSNNKKDMSNNTNMSNKKMNL